MRMNCRLFRVLFNKVVRRALHSTRLGDKYQPSLVEGPEKAIKLRRITNENKAEHFSLLLPPPNVTGQLHLGHILTTTVEDVLVKWKQLNGYTVEWVPGTDHAGIATQTVVERKLRNKKGLSKHDLGRTAFIDEVVQWKTEKEAQIMKDLMQLGLSLNWAKQYFTLDDHQSRATVHAFITLFDKGLIYRDNAIVNWSCSLGTAISDIEVETIEVDGPTLITVPGYKEPVKFGELTEFAYVFQDNENEEIVVSTTRPETVLGDVAVAVHPDDPRYKKYLGTKRKLWHPFREQPIPLIFDKSVDINFGTGAVKITPAHDKFDLDMANRHGLLYHSVINEKGVILPNHGIFSGLKRFEARERVKWAIASLGLFRSSTPHKMAVPICSRSKDVVEYLKKPQWYLRTKAMAKKAADSVREGELRIVPSTYENEWFRYLDQNRDWCISRQLWWGHRLPLYRYQINKIDHWVAAESMEQAKLKLEKLSTRLLNVKLERDADVLDTWFSSALLPFSVHGWPGEDTANKNNYPLSIMETGHDILFFWVARMVMLGVELTGQLPFKEILLHGIICDAHGRKMSKSLGNVILPEYVIKGASLEELIKDTEKAHRTGLISFHECEKSKDGQRKQFPSGIAECGTDALRFTLLSHNIKSHFLHFDVNECVANKLFFNKVWQATKYTLKAIAFVNVSTLNVNTLELTDIDKWILSKLGHMVTAFESGMETHNYHLATAAVKKFLYNNFCDVYLETTKMNVREKAGAAEGHCVTLLTCLNVGVLYMSAFTPFLATELQKYLIEVPPFNHHFWKDDHLEDEVSEIIALCSSIRQIKSQHNITGKHEPRIDLLTEDDMFHHKLHRYLNIVLSLAMLRQGHIFRSKQDFESVHHAVKSQATDKCTFGISTNDSYKPVKRAEDNGKRIAKVSRELERLQSVVSSVGYQTKAKDTVKSKHVEQIKHLERELKKLKEALE